MTDLSQPPGDAPLFDVSPAASEQIQTRCFGLVTVIDIGADAFEQLAMEHRKDEDARLMFDHLLCAAVRGPNGERFTPDMLKRLPARAFHDRVKLMNATLLVNGQSPDEVGKV